MLSQGTPLLLAGDELGNSQGGNNNAFAQDNPVGWVDWGPECTGDDPDFLRFVQKIVAFRRAHPVLRQTRFLHSRNRPADGKEDLFWRNAAGTPLSDRDWRDPELRHLVAEVRTASTAPEYAQSDDAILAVFNVGPGITVTLPDPPEGRLWMRRIDTAEPDAPPRPMRGRMRVAAHSVVVLVQEATGPIS
jgi:glycogen operon protein